MYFDSRETPIKKILALTVEFSTAVKTVEAAATEQFSGSLNNIYFHALQTTDVRNDRLIALRDAVEMLSILSDSIIENGYDYDKILSGDDLDAVSGPRP